MGVGLGLMGERGLSLEVGVRSVGEAMDFFGGGEGRRASIESLCFLPRSCEEGTGFLPRRLITLSIFLVLWMRPYPITVHYQASQYDAQVLAQKIGRKRKEILQLFINKVIFY